MSSDKSTRRGFLEIILGGSILATIGAILYPVIKYIMPPAAGEAKLSQLKLPFTREDIAADPKRSKYFKYGRNLGIIFLTDQDELKALSATCTHLDCTVQNRPEEGIIWCSCHNGKYDLNGNNISGPPPRPLERYLVQETQGNIIVSREVV